jgi:hypothetical protein
VESDQLQREACQVEFNLKYIVSCCIKVDKKPLRYGVIDLMRRVDPAVTGSGPVEHQKNRIYPPKRGGNYLALRMLADVSL